MPESRADTKRVMNGGIFLYINGKAGDEQQPGTDDERRREAGILGAEIQFGGRVVGEAYDGEHYAGDDE